MIKKVDDKNSLSEISASPKNASVSSEKVFLIKPPFSIREISSTELPRRRAGFGDGIRKVTVGL
jgi:hypothetical protein